jgi:ribosomal protein S12 methylthiotransferase accessory factor YcaO
MLALNPYGLAAKALAVLLAILGAAWVGWHYGDYYRGLECEIAVSAARHAADRALTEAIQEKSAVESRLADARYQIDTDDAKRQTEIDRLRDDNRRLASSLRLRKPAHCPSRADTVPDSAGTAASAHEADPAGEFSRAGREWAIKLHQEINK